METKEQKIERRLTETEKLMEKYDKAIKKYDKAIKKMGKSKDLLKAVEGNLRECGVEINNLSDGEFEYVIKSLILATEAVGEKSKIKDDYFFEISEKVINETKNSDVAQLKRLISMEKLEIEICNKRIEVLTQLLKRRAY